MTAIRTLLVDDSFEFVEAAQRFLSLDPQIEIIGYALSGEAAIEQVNCLHPDLVLMDLAMPGLNGLETTRKIKAQDAAPIIIILTLHDDPEYLLASQVVRADGFVAKPDFGVKLIPQIYSLFEETVAQH
jgi:DNA-binding NarL/FixJ family response regulator